jgi:hypothetical protein
MFRVNLEEPDSLFQSEITQKRMFKVVPWTQALKYFQLLP